MKKIILRLFEREREYFNVNRFDGSRFVYNDELVLAEFGNFNNASGTS